MVLIFKTCSEAIVRTSKAGLVLLLAAVFSTPAAAQVPLNPATLPDSVFTPANQPEIAHADSIIRFSDQAFAADSLKQMRQKKLVRRLVIPAAGAGALVSTYLFLDHDVRNDVPNDESPFKDFVSEWAEPMGRSVTILPGFGAALTYGFIAKDKRARKAGVLGIASFYLNDGLSTQLKKGFGRMRGIL